MSAGSVASHATVFSLGQLYPVFVGVQTCHFPFHHHRLLSSVVGARQPESARHAAFSALREVLRSRQKPKNDHFLCDYHRSVHGALHNGYLRRSRCCVNDMVAFRGSHGEKKSKIPIK